METAKHTPGPWALDGSVVRTSDRPICEIYRELRASEATLANAALIVAAPDILAALKLAFQHGTISDSESRMNIVAAAIVKAEGRA